MDFHKAFAQSGKNPQSILKIVLGISLALLIMWLFLVSKMDTGSVTQSNDPEVQERTVGLQESLKKPAVKKAEESKREEPAMFQNAFITFLFMVTVLGGVWYWSKKKEGKAIAGPKSREIDSHVLSEKAQLKFVEVNDEVWVLGLGEHGINLLHRYPKGEWNENRLGTAEKLDTEQNVIKKETGKGDFKSLFKLVSN